MHRAPAIPGFRVLRALGRGGMGAVLLVEPAALPGAQRALKLLEVGDPERRARFLREAALLARVDRCPGVVRVHDVGEHEGLLWLCMEYVEGRDLGRVLAERGPLPWEEAVRLARDLAQGLAEVHARGVVHRDLKPQNVVVDAGGAPYLLDFGVAQATDLERLTLSGMAMGTPAYFSPEQTSGRPVDGKSDVYSLGVTLYELLTGDVPFPDDVPLGALVRAILHERPEPPGARRPEVPAAVDRAVMGALDKDPARRPDAAAFAAQLDAALRRPRGATTGERLARFAARRGPRRAALAALALLPGLALAGAALLVTEAAPRAPALRGAEPAAPAAHPAPGRSASPGALDELEALLERGEALRALGWINARRDAAGGERRALVAAAPPVEARARARVVGALADPAAAPDDVVALVGVVARLRELAPPDDPGADLAHAALVAVRDEARAALAAGAGAPSAPLVASVTDRIGVLAACGEAGVRATDRALGLAAADALADLRGERLVDDALYVPALAALVDLDVGVEYSHLARVTTAPGLGRSRPALELIRLRLDLALSLEAAMAGEANRRRLLELVTSERGRVFGPVTRSRGLCLGIHDRMLPADAFKVASEARDLDSSSPYPHLALARALLLRDGPEAAEAAGREVAVALQRFDALRGQGHLRRAFDQVPVLRAGVGLYAWMGRDDDARALIARARALPDAPPEWIEQLERHREDMRTRRAAPRDF